MNKFNSYVLCLASKAVEQFKARLDGVPLILSEDDMRYPSGGYEYVCIYNHKEYGTYRIYHSSLGSALDTLEGRKHKIKCGAVYVNGCIWVAYVPAISDSICFVNYRPNTRSGYLLSAFNCPDLYEILERKGDL